MTLLEARMLHWDCQTDLGVWARANGYRFTEEQHMRTMVEAAANAASGAGISHSLHLLGLATDLNPFKDGVFLKTVEEIRPIGEYWKSLNPLCRWGGDFSRPDADHFSIEWQGVK